ELTARRARSLQKKVHSLIYKKSLHGSRHLLHVAIIREKDKRAPIGLLDEMRDPMLQLFLISGVARVGHLLHDKHFHLPLKIERAAKLQRLRLRRARALTKIGEIRPTHGQSGARSEERRVGKEC